jgi:LytS/YehU family sensor histidine kinase
VSRVEDRLRLEVWDDGSGSSQAEGNGIGLENTRRRLEHQYGAAQRLVLERVDDGTRVLVEIPYRLATA